MPPIFTWNVRVYYEDTDAGGVVFYANYLKFFERARTEWLRAAGVSRLDMIADSTIFAVKNAAIDYRAPALLDDELTLTVIVQKLGRASLVFFQEVWRGTDLLTTASITIACVHTQTLRPCAIPAHAWEKIAAVPIQAGNGNT